MSKVCCFKCLRMTELQEVPTGETVGGNSQPWCQWCSEPLAVSRADRFFQLEAAALSGLLAAPSILSDATCDEIAASARDHARAALDDIDCRVESGALFGR